MTSSSPIKIITYTLLALIAFAGNSVLCRLALGEQLIDPASFTVIRMISAALTLVIILQFVSTREASKANKTESAVNEKENRQGNHGSWGASLMLFVYAVAFSYAYVSLDTATGALILFASVQLTMICISVFSGARLHITEWLGGSIAFIGFIYLVLPTVTAPSFIGFMLMTLAGIAWGIYTLKGRQSKNALLDTAYNFFRTVPLSLILLIILLTNLEATTTKQGVVLAVVAGAITSGIGYTIWYSALTGLSSVQAAVLQLTVPIIAAFGGVIFVSEAISLRLVISASIILGGILLVVSGRKLMANTSVERWK